MHLRDILAGVLPFLAAGMWAGCQPAGESHRVPPGEALEEAHAALLRNAEHTPESLATRRVSSILDSLGMTPGEYRLGVAGLGGRADSWREFYAGSVRRLETAPGARPGARPFRARVGEDPAVPASR
ncbi:MAG: hypothetical protein WB626_11135 [Bacteroidota bacterium]